MPEIFSTATSKTQLCKTLSVTESTICLEKSAHKRITSFSNALFSLLGRTHHAPTFAHKSSMSGRSLTFLSQKINIQNEAVL